MYYAEKNNYPAFRQLKKTAETIGSQTGQKLSGTVRRYDLSF
jgi:hypothetical protein